MAVYPVVVIVIVVDHITFIGVMFTNNPTNGNPDQIVLNLFDGCGEAIVGGQVFNNIILYISIDRSHLIQLLSVVNVN